MSFTFGPLERRGLLGPVPGACAACLATGVGAAVVILDISPTPGGVLASLTAIGVSAACALLPFGGRSVAQWGPVAGAHLRRRARGAHRFATARPQVGTRVRLGDGSSQGITPPPSPPPQLRGVRIISTGYHGRTIGALAEDCARRLTAVLACRVPAFALLDPDAQERRLTRWGHVLASAGGSHLRRLQWIERTAPAPVDELARWVAAERDPALPARDAPVIDSYLELIESAGAAAEMHEVLIAIQVDARRTREPRRSDPLELLVEAAERVARGLRAAEVAVLGALGPEQLAETLRTAFDPYQRADLARLQTADPQRRGLAEGSAWPAAASEAWDHYRCDGAQHATYWIGSWPRLEVSPLFLSPVLGSSGAVRTVAVTFEPIPSARSTRDVEAAVTRDRADRELRARLGQSETARQRQSREATTRREAELAAGHGEVRFSGFITVSGRDADELRRSCAEVVDQAARAHLELHRLYGQQGDAFTFTLPLARGLR
ncbi:MAG TPA: SCO6880 family protein [Solirubrobacteraceae bacterium]|nr:SCO6880 family protein [Solirubrobacteraceae bacterium]